MNLDISSQFCIANDKRFFTTNTKLYELWQSPHMVLPGRGVISFTKMVNITIIRLWIFNILNLLHN